MERFAIIGLGRYGRRLGRLLHEAGAEVIATDKDRMLVEDIRDHVTLAVCRDGTDDEALRSQGIDKVDVAVVAMGDAFEDAVMTTVLLKRLGVKRVISRAATQIRGEILSQVGADDIVNPERESALDKAVEVLEGIRSGELFPLQPPHWMVEVAAVITRLRPAIAEGSIRLLDAMELPIDRDIETLVRATELAATLDHHVFDTLYHSVALAGDATLITADERYLRKARHLGAILGLGSYASEQRS